MSRTTRPSRVPPLLVKLQQAEQRNSQHADPRRNGTAALTDLAKGSARRPQQSATASIEDIGTSHDDRAYDALDEATQRRLHQALDRLLREDPFLAYVDETADFYRVRRKDDVVFEYPKWRNVPEAFPRLVPPQSSAAFRWLGWSLLGLIPAGLGTLICAPVTLLLSLRLLRRSSDRVEVARAWVLIGISTVIGAVGLSLAYLFLLHF